MKKIKFLLTVLIFSFVSTTVLAQNPCKQITSAALINLTNALEHNNFDQTDRFLNSIEASCAQTEFVLRTKIINTIIQKKDAESLINDYLTKKYDNVLIYRFDNAAEKDFQKRYSKSEAKFEYIPLNHQVDSLLKIKSSSLLQSENYTLSNKEIAILQLFADDIETYFAEIDKKPSKQSKLGQAIEQQEFKSKPTFGIHAGAFIPFEKNGYFTSAPVIGFSFMSPLDNNFIYEFQYKFRVDDQAGTFEFKDNDNSIRDISASTAHHFTLGFGYKVFDNEKFIILPKLNVGLGMIWTGVSEKTYETDEYGAEIESVNYKNINTMHSTAGITFMRHLGRKMYLGFETSYHFVPYKWSSYLNSPIQSQYASFEIFFRF